MLMIYSFLKKYMVEWRMVKAARQRTDRGPMGGLRRSEETHARENGEMKK
jgi:hypothetical protein